MRLILISLITLVLAGAVGLGATWLTAARGTSFGALTIGAWTARPRTGTVGIDPYARASVARSGELPIGAGDGVAFSATAAFQAAVVVCGAPAGTGSLRGRSGPAARISASCREAAARSPASAPVSRPAGRRPVRRRAQWV